MIGFGFFFSPVLILKINLISSFLELMLGFYHHQGGLPGEVGRMYPMKWFDVERASSVEGPVKVHGERHRDRRRQRRGQGQKFMWQERAGFKWRLSIILCLSIHTATQTKMKTSDTKSEVLHGCVCVWDRFTPGPQTAISWSKYLLHTHTHTHTEMWETKHWS